MKLVKSGEFRFAGGVAACIFDKDIPALTIKLPYRASYGMGERFDTLNQKGRTVINRVEEHFCHQGDKTYCPMPFFFTDSGFGLFFNTKKVSVFEFGENEITVRFLQDYTVDAQRDFWEQTDVFLFSGTPSSIISEYMAATGKAKPIPKWALGVWISANRWHSQPQIEEQLALLEKYDFPANVLVIEAWSDEATFYIFNGADYKAGAGDKVFKYEDFDFQKSAYWNNPAAMIRKLHERNIHLILWQIPAYKTPAPNDARCAQHEEDRAFAIEHGLCIKNSRGEAYKIPSGNWFAGSTIPDFTNPETERLWFAKRQYLLDIGVDGFKTDGGEFIYEADLQASDSSMSGTDMKNAYAQSYIASYQKFLDGFTEKVLFSRAGYTGQHTTPILWSGDQQSSFGELRSQLCAGLSASLSGVIFWGFDIGGFAGKLPDFDLYMRATQMACFSPVMQWHSEPEGGQFGGVDGTGNNERSPWNIAFFASKNDEKKGSAALSALRFWHRVRMNLLPYLYSESRRCVTHNAPLMRALVYDFGFDERALYIEDQFMLGESLLVCPVLCAGCVRRSVYLPEGVWYGLFDNKRYEGTQTLDIPCKDIIPVFARGGTALALNLSDSELGSPVGNAVDTYETLCFRLYGEAGSAHFEDDLGNNFEIIWTASHIDTTGNVLYEPKYVRIDTSESV
jgi:alpha-D-xyloside xylohydrolase